MSVQIGDPYKYIRGRKFARGRIRTIRKMKIKSEKTEYLIR